MLELYHLGNSRFCGWITFTQHLQRAFEAVGMETRLHRIVTKPGPCKFSGLQCHGITLDAAVASPQRKLIIGAAKGWWHEANPLLDAGAHIVMHSPHEVKQAEQFPEGRVITIRRALKVPGATFIRHPYQPLDLKAARRTRNAVSVARVARVKRPDIILAANRILKPEQRVELLGFEDRMYTHFQLKKLFPEWEAAKDHPRSSEDSVRAMLNARYSVDMTDFGLAGADGGGTQYTFLEAWDAGATLVINKKWVDDYPDDDMKAGVNCLAVSTPESLAVALRSTKSRSDLREAGRAQLELHDPKLIGQQYLNALGM